MAHVNDHVANDNSHLGIMEKATTFSFSSRADNVVECFALCVYIVIVWHAVIVQRVCGRGTTEMA
eukprot:4725919-Ditylum_brightwellii.AAC.1